MEGPQSFWGRLLETISFRSTRWLGLCLLAAFFFALLRGWSQPFAFRLGSVAPRGVVSRVAFEKPDLARTRAAQQRATSQVRVVYIQDRSPLVRIRDGLKNRVAEIAAAETLAGVSRAAWLEFAPETAAVLERLPVPAPGTVVKPAELPIAPEPPDFSMQEEPGDKDEIPSLGPNILGSSKNQGVQKAGGSKKGTPSSEDIGFADDVIRAQAQPKADLETAKDQAKANPSVTEFTREKLQAEQAFTASEIQSVLRKSFLSSTKPLIVHFHLWKLKVFWKRFSTILMREAKQKLTSTHLAT